MVKGRHRRSTAIAVALALAGAPLAIAPFEAAPLAPSAALAATSLEAEVSAREVQDGATFDLLLSAKGDDPGDPPDFSVLERDFDILGTRQVRRMTVTNGRREDSVDWIVTLASRAPGEYEIPSIRAGDATSEPIAIRVVAAGAPAGSTSGAASGTTTGAPSGRTSGAASGTPSGTSSDTQRGDTARDDAPDLFVEASVDDAKPYVQGEVRYTVRVYDGVGIRDGALTEPRADGASFTPLGEPRSYERTVNGRRYRVHERDFALAPQASGKLVIPPVTLQARVPEPRPQARSRSLFDDMLGDDFFGRDRFADDVLGAFGRGAFAGFPSSILERMMGLGGREVRVRSNPVALDVQARPADAASGWFLPARRVELAQTWQPARPTFRVGESVSRTIVLRALGAAAEQLPEIEIPAADGIRQYPEGTRHATAPAGDGLESVREQTVAIVPTRPGQMTLPAIEVRWWDVEAKQARTARLPEQAIEVLPAGDTSDATASAAVATAPAKPSNEAGEPTAPNAAPASGGSASASQDSASKASATDADPPFAAAWSHPGTVALGAAAAALLAVGGAWLTLRRRRAAAAPLPSSASPAGSIEAPAAPSRQLAALRAACASGDARAARDALLRWGRAVWPDSPPATTAAVARRLGHDGLSSAVAELDACLYSPGATPWDGARLERELDAARAAAKNAGDGASPAVLPGLYPPRRAA